METVLNAIADWIKGILAGAIMSNLSGLFDSVNEQVGEIATQVGTSPADFEWAQVLRTLNPVYLR